MNLKFMNQMENWEKEVDNINWKSMLDTIDQALIHNMAAEIGFPNYEQLEQASELIVGDHYICHTSDSRWVFWNPTTYADQDPSFFEDKQEAIDYIADYLTLRGEKKERLAQGLEKVTQTRRCNYCEYEFSPTDPTRDEWDEEKEGKYCSADCATQSVIEELKET